jgi:hypothetical protein
VVEIEFVENGQTVLVRFTKGLLALDRETFVQGPKRVTTSFTSVRSEADLV